MYEIESIFFNYAVFGEEYRAETVTLTEHRPGFSSIPYNLLG